jgi:hypothetical protein
MFQQQLLFLVDQTILFNGCLIIIFALINVTGVGMSPIPRHTSNNLLINLIKLPGGYKSLNIVLISVDE